MRKRISSNNLCQQARDAGYDFKQTDDLDKHEGFAEKLVRRRQFGNPILSSDVSLASDRELKRIFHV